MLAEKKIHIRDAQVAATYQTQESERVCALHMAEATAHRRAKHDTRLLSNSNCQLCSEQKENVLKQSPDTDPHIHNQLRGKTVLLMPSQNHGRGTLHIGKQSGAKITTPSLGVICVFRTQVRISRFLP